MVTHPFHPLRGQELVVLFERKWAGGHLYVCEGGPLGTIGLPASWTSLSAPPGETPQSDGVCAGRRRRRSASTPSRRHASTRWWRKRSVWAGQPPASR
ncbi:MAG: hypothetical protein JO352_04765 [Chloroflexi bacterium]|nr:hypothetical protein [Chloroflexota bacterium]